MKRFETSDGTHSVYISRTHKPEPGQNENCWWIHLYGTEGPDTKLVYYSEDERDADLKRVKAEIQAAIDAVGKWEAWECGSVFHVMRLKDTREEFHSGNIEYAHRFYPDEPENYATLEEAREAAKILNLLPVIIP